MAKEALKSTEDSLDKLTNECITGVSRSCQ